ncbi:MAG: MFS transporter [Planctomycetota bacterium]
MAETASFDRRIRALRAFATVTYPFACVPFLWFWFRDHGVDAVGYGTIIALYYLAMVVAEVPTGVLADRFGRRSVLIAGPFVLAAGFFVAWASPDFLGFCIAEVLLGLGHSLLSGAPAALLFDTLDHHGRTRDYHRQESIANTLRLLGTGIAFLLGGVLVASLGIESAILATVALCMLAGIVASFVDEPRHAQANLRPRILTAIRTDLRQPEVRWIGAYYVLLFCLLRFPFHTYQPFLAKSGNDDPLFLGALFFALNLVALPFARSTPWLVSRIGSRAIFWSMPLSIGLSLIAMAGHFDALGIALFFVHQIPFGMHWAVVHDYANHRLGSTSRATVLSLMSFLGRIAFAALFPLAMSATELATSYRVVGTIAIIGTVIVMWPMPREAPR